MNSFPYESPPAPPVVVRQPVYFLLLSEMNIVYYEFRLYNIEDRVPYNAECLLIWLNYQQSIILLEITAKELHKESKQIRNPKAI